MECKVPDLGRNTDSYAAYRRRPLLVRVRPVSSPTADEGEEEDADEGGKVDADDAAPALGENG